MPISIDLRSDYDGHFFRLPFVFVPSRQRLHNRKSNTHSRRGAALFRAGLPRCVQALTVVQFPFLDIYAIKKLIRIPVRHEPMQLYVELQRPENYSAKRIQSPNRIGPLRQL